jgi:hypothetical protein
MELQLLWEWWWQQANATLMWQGIGAMNKDQCQWILVRRWAMRAIDEGKQQKQGNNDK